MANKFAEDVRRIVGTDDDTAVDPELEQPGGRESVRGIGSQTVGGRTIATGGVDIDGAEEETDEDGNPTDKKTNEKSQKEAEESADEPNENDQTTLSHNAEAGVVDADKLIDGEDGPGMKESSVDAISRNVSSTPGGRLVGINATDCDTGKALKIRIDGNQTPKPETTSENGDVIVPAWDRPDEPPKDQVWEENKYWACSGNCEGWMTRYQSIEDYAAQAESQYIASGGFSLTILEVNYDGIGIDLSDDPDKGMVEQEQLSTEEGALVTKTVSFARADCAEGDTDDVCGISEIPNISDFWPDDDTISLTKEDGKFKPSQYDADATTKYVGQSTSSVDFCMDGGRTGRIRQGRDGGTVIHETSGGAPTGNFKFYSSDGTLAAAGDVTALNSVLPRDSD